jgi:mRNA interferase HigB
LQGGSGRLIFDIGGNKYRLIASVDFEEQLFVIEQVLTHSDYDREVF